MSKGVISMRKKRSEKEDKFIGFSFEMFLCILLKLRKERRLENTYAKRYWQLSLFFCLPVLFPSTHPLSGLFDHEIDTRILLTGEIKSDWFVVSYLFLGMCNLTLMKNVIRYVGYIIILIKCIKLIKPNRQNLLFLSYIHVLNPSNPRESITNMEGCLANWHVDWVSYWIFLSKHRETM